MPFGWLYLVQRVYYAYEDARTPVLLQLVVTVVATAANLVALAGPRPSAPASSSGIGQTREQPRRRRGRFVAAAPPARLAAPAADDPAATSGWPSPPSWLRCPPRGRWVLAGSCRGVDHGAGRAPCVVLVVGGLGVLCPVALGVAHALRVARSAQLLDPRAAPRCVRRPVLSGPHPRMSAHHGVHTARVHET